MARLVIAPLVTDARPPTGARGGGRRARPRTTPGQLRMGVALVVLLACGLGVLSGMVFAALEEGFTVIGGHDAPLVEQSNALYYAVNDMDAQVGNVLLTGDDPALAADQQQDLALYASDEQHAEQDLQQVAVTAAADPAAQRAVTSVLDALGIFSYDAALAADIRAYEADHADVRFGGYLGAEFRNITFTGERAAATRALLAYQVYERYDRVLRATAKTNLTQAIAFDIGTSPGQSDWAFNRWDAALGSVIAINENAFTAAIRDGHTTGSPWIALIPALGTALIVGLAIAGTRPRLGEYRR
jgi:hypothetical protein